MQLQTLAHSGHVADNGADLSHRISPAQSTDANSEIVGLPPRGVDLAQLVDPRDDVDGVAQVVVDSLALQDRAPAPGRVQMVAEDVDGRLGRGDLAAPHLLGAGTFTRPIRENGPAHSRAERFNPRNVLLSCEVEAWLD